MSIPEQQQDSAATPLRIACIGGGPGGLFTSIALAHSIPAATVDVFERNLESDVFGFGVVFSDATLDNIDRVDPILRDTLAERGRHWESIAVHAHDNITAAGGNGMSAVHRRVLLGALRGRAAELGARLHYSVDTSVLALDATGDYDLIVAADGTNSASRESFSGELGHSVEEAAVKFIWFGTTYQFDGLTFLHKQSEHGNFAVHAYPIGSELSTFIVETDEETWRRAGLDGFDMTLPPGQSDLVTQRYLEELFADQIDGANLVANNSRWSNFRTRRTDSWHTHTDRGTPVVFLGDAMHTAHFSVGSGTKMAMEDAAVLAQTVAEASSDLDSALQKFEQIRKPQVAKVQNSSVPSLAWWDHFGEYYQELEPWQFGFHFFTRSISAEKTRVRDPRFVEDAERSWHEQNGAAPLETPLKIGAVEFRSRLLKLAPANTLDSVRLTDGNSVSDALPVYSASDSDRTSLDADSVSRLDSLCAAGAGAVIIRHGTELSRVLAAEYVRLHHHLSAIVVDRETSVRARRAVDERDCAATLVLSGRADAVAFEKGSVDDTATTTTEVSK
ncbi:FAD-dependent monooxygenase [Rhodococcoides fascians]|uniref:FAD-dependent monooxygenase n=1 Tax=Rhodococcoides fascians TaxID=1828 RepID=UPI00068F5F04|nr:MULTISPECIES: FAD-dependent monooxygenase [Rhodococcus]OZE95460.1 2-polyprenyl-6-methoxyphenol hydroxylase [Rhodococcus sp. 15-1189-1-1a]OZF10090.1 2-polyprenyl-6-methoxyphenol hydroxylase [Rhodococcus sp. 14-2686-1-2]